MAGILEEAGLPPLLEAGIRPWVAAVETGTLGMRDAVTSAASGTATSLKRRIAMTPDLDIAIAEAVVASVAFAAALDTRGANTPKPRAEALAALKGVIEKLRTAQPSENTIALGLGW